MTGFNSHLSRTFEVMFLLSRMRVTYVFRLVGFFFATRQHVEAATVPASLIPTSTRASAPLYPRRKLIKVSGATGTTGGTCTLRVYVYRITWCTGGYWHGNCVDSSQALVPTGNCHSPSPSLSWVDLVEWLVGCSGHGEHSPMYQEL